METKRDVDKVISDLTVCIRKSALMCRIAKSVIRKMPWWSRKLYVLRYKLMKARKTFQANPNETTMLNYREQKKTYQKEIRQAKCNWWNTFFSENINRDPYAVLRCLDSSERSTSEIFEISLNGTSYRNPVDMATALGESFFPDMYEPFTLRQAIMSDGVTDYLNTIPQTEVPEILDEELHDAVFSIDRKKAPGEDGIQPFILQDFYVLLKPYLSAIFNKCLALKYFLKHWKKAVVMPLKKPNRTDYRLTSNYRPLSLLSTAGKIFEKVINTSLKW